MALSLPLCGSAPKSLPRPPDMPLPDLSERCVVCGMSALPSTYDSDDPVCAEHVGGPPSIFGQGDPELRAIRHIPLESAEAIESVADYLLDAYSDHSDVAAFRLLGAAYVARGKGEKWVEYHYGVCGSARMLERLSTEGLNAIAELW